MSTRKDYCTKKSTDKKSELLKPILFSCPRVREILQAISEVHEGPKMGLEPSCLLIVGGTGTGKTTAVKCYENWFPRFDDGDGMVIPILSSRVPAPATIKGIATQLLDALDDELACEGTLTSQTMRLHRLMKSAGVELLIMDEVQHFLSCSPSSVPVACDWLASLSNTTGVPIVFIGTPDVVDVLNCHHGLSRRLTVIELKPFGWETKREQEDFKSLLKAVEMKLPIRQSIPLSSPEMAFRLLCSSDGVMSHLMGIIKTAAVFALQRGKKVVTRAEFAKAYRFRRPLSASRQENPFIVDIGALTTPSRGHGSLN